MANWWMATASSTKGRAVLETHPRPELRAVGFFLQDWGIRTPREHREMVLQFVQNQRLK